MKNHMIIGCLLMGLALLGCEKKEPIEQAVAVVYPTAGYQTFGKVAFSESADGVQVSALIYNLTPGKHGFHVHQYGDCSSGDGKAAGGHYNPHHHDHAGADAPVRHVGDLGNIVANEDGIGILQYTDTHVTLNGPHSIIGRAVIIHAGEDDLSSQPSGAAGARVGCGTIGISH